MNNLKNILLFFLLCLGLSTFREATAEEDKFRLVEVPKGALRGHLSLDQVNEWMKLTVIGANGYAKLRPIGKSIEDRDILALCIGKSCSTERTIRETGEALFTALHHAREPLGMMALVYFINDLLKSGFIDKDPSALHLLNTRRLEFVMVVNPDAYVWNERNPRGMRRKNMRDTSEKCGLKKSEDFEHGVDLNRNYDFCFHRDTVGSSRDPCAIDYEGPSPFSEPETKAVKAFVESRRFNVAFNYHSFGRQVYIPYSCKSEGPTMEDAYFRDYAKRLTKVNKFEYGQPWATNLYSVNGDASDWMYRYHGIVAVSPEVSPGDPVKSERDGFWVDEANIEGWSKENDEMNYHGAWTAGIMLEVRPVEGDLSNNVLKFEVLNIGLLPTKGLVDVAVAPLTVRRSLSDDKAVTTRKGKARQATHRLGFSVSSSAAAATTLSVNDRRILKSNPQNETLVRPKLKDLSKRFTEKPFMGSSNKDEKTKSTRQALREKGKNRFVEVLRMNSLPTKDFLVAARDSMDCVVYRGSIVNDSQVDLTIQARLGADHTTCEQVYTSRFENLDKLVEVDTVDVSEIDEAVPSPSTGPSTLKLFAFIGFLICLLATMVFLWQRIKMRRETSSASFNASKVGHDEDDAYDAELPEESDVFVPGRTVSVASSSTTVTPKLPPV